MTSRPIEPWCLCLRKLACPTVFRLRCRICSTLGRCSWHSLQCHFSSIWTIYCDTFRLHWNNAAYWILHEGFLWLASRLYFKRALHHFHVLAIWGLSMGAHYRWFWIEAFLPGVGRSPVRPLIQLTSPFERMQDS